MFCSKCGKTIYPEDAVCPSCGAAIGDNRFGGIPYTSAQFTIAPGQTEFEPQVDYAPQNNYTRTSYTGMKNAAQEDGEVDTRTTYRPVYEGTTVPEDMRREMRAALTPDAPEEAETPENEPAPAPVEAEVYDTPVTLSPAAQETLDEIDQDLQPDEQIDREQFRRRPIETKGRAGISEDVSEYIRKLENGQGRRTSRRSSVYDDYAEPEAREFDGETAAAEGEDSDEFYESDEAYDDIPEEDYDDMEPEHTFGLAQILKILVALIVVAAIVFGVVKWIGYVRGKQPSSPIEGVSKSLYEDGIALVKSHTDSEYINTLIGKYTSDGILPMSAALEADNNAINALLPEEPSANDPTFISALLSIQNNIGSAVTMDALSVGSASETAVADSEARWQIVSSSIAQLESATSAAELTAVINGQTITVQTETPEPTQEVTVYATLQKGDESNDVLALQLRLYELGYLTDKCDGAFGSKTQTAIKLFQQTTGMNATGIADNDTQNALYAEDAPYAPGVETPAPTAEPTPEPTPEPAPVEESAAEEGQAA